VCVCLSCIYNSTSSLVARADESAQITDALMRRMDRCNAVTGQLQGIFDGATSDQQAEIIRRKLRALQRRLDSEDYASMAHLFRDNLRTAAVDHSSLLPPGESHRRTTAQSDACRAKMETLARQVHVRLLTIKSAHTAT